MKNPRDVINHCVEEFESRTQIELVVSIKKQSDSYYNFFWFYTLVAVQIFWISALLLNDSFDFEILCIESFVLILISYLVLMRLEILKYLIPKKIKKTNLIKAAGREFYNLGMFNTRLRSGLLIKYSHWENDCILVPDKGVLQKISKEELESFTKDFQKAFKGKELSDSVGSQIRTFGVFWKSKWPNEDDENEIVQAYTDDSI